MAFVQTRLVEGFAYRNFQSFYKVSGGTVSGFREEYSGLLFTRYPCNSLVRETVRSQLRLLIPAAFFDKTRNKSLVRYGSENNQPVTLQEKLGRTYGVVYYRHERVRNGKVVLSKALGSDDLRPRLVLRFGIFSLRSEA